MDDKGTAGTAFIPRQSLSANINSFDSTDKILDEIDAKLNGVTSTHVQEKDVNEDPGVDVSSVRKFRHHMESQSVESKPPAASKSYSFDFIHYDEAKDSNKPTNSFHEQRTNLLRLYDDDINLLRKMLQGNGEDTKVPCEIVGRSAQHEMPQHNDDPSALEQAVDIETGAKADQTIGENRHVSTIVDEVVQCTCGLEEELEKMTKDRDELRARIRRGEASRTSIEERQELERQLHSAKAALFQQKKKSRLQLEDIEEKLDEAQHYYDEKLLEKDELIESLRDEITTLSKRASPAPPTSTYPTPILPSKDDRVEKELAEKDNEIKRLSDLVSKQDQALTELKKRLGDDTNKSFIQACQEVSAERQKWRDKYDDFKLKADKEHSDLEKKLNALENEKQALCADNLNLTHQLEDIQLEVEKKETKLKNEGLQKESDYRTTIDLLKKKIESLKDELSLAFSSKSELELNFRRRESEFSHVEKNLKEENQKLDDELQRMRKEVSQAVTKLKDFKVEIEHQDQSLAASIYDQCRKLSALLQKMHPSELHSRKTFHAKGSLACKRAVSELHDIVESLTRSTDDLLSDLNRVKRESRKRHDFSSLLSNNDVTLASKEAKLLRNKLDEKESELQDLQINMHHWRDLTAQRLAEKFQEELELQVERKLSQYRGDNFHKANESKHELGRFSKSTNNLTSNNSHSAKQHSDTSTVKLLCHLQGRVKQLRTENDLLRSSNFIKDLDSC